MSLGLLEMYFGGAIDVTIYTATLGWYVVNWWVTGRIFITPDKDAESYSRSFTFLASRYFKTAENYLGVISSIGFNPEAILQSGTGLLGETGSSVYFLKSHRFGFDAQKTLGSIFLITAQITWSDLELSFDRGNFVNNWIGQLSVSYRF
jgi:YaiO family outer membrane protein